MFRQFTLSVVSRLALALMVAVCLGAPLVTPSQAAPRAAPAMAGMAMDEHAPAGHMGDCAPGGAVMVCAGCAVVLPAPAAAVPVRYAVPAVFAAPVATSRTGRAVDPDPPVPRSQVRSQKL